MGLVLPIAGGQPQLNYLNHCVSLFDFQTKDDLQPGSYV